MTKGGSASGEVLISADSHVSDFPNLWNGPIDAKFGSRAMHVSKDGGSSAHGLSPRGLYGDWVVAEGLLPFPSGGGNVGGYPHAERGKRLADFHIDRDTPKGAIETKARLEAMDTDGVRAEVIYPTYALRVPMMRDAELQRDLLRHSNAWLAEYVRPAPDRLVGGAVLSLIDVNAAVEDLHECLKSGLRAVTVAAVPPPELTYASMHYDRFWAAAAEAGVPVTLHALPPPETAAASQRRRPTVAESRLMHLIEDYHLANILYDHPIQVCASQIILSGVLERHPKLKLVLSEWGTGWIPTFLANIDLTWSNRPEGLPLKMAPSEYFSRQIWCTFDRPLHMQPADVERLQDRLMFASDYPHVESSWPESRGAFDKYVGDVPAAIRKKLASDNAAALFGLTAS